MNHAEVLFEPRLDSMSSPRIDEPCRKADRNTIASPFHQDGWHDPTMENPWCEKHDGGVKGQSIGKHWDSNGEPERLHRVRPFEADCQGLPECVVACICPQNLSALVVRTVVKEWGHSLHLEKSTKKASVVWS